MRVALCFWGLCRSTHLTIDSIEKYIFTALRDAGITYDVYVHTYTLYRPYTNIRSNEVGIQLKNTNWKRLKAVKWIVENQDTVDKTLQFEKYRSKGDPWKFETNNESFATLDNHIRALWSLYQVTTLWNVSGIEYSKILYLRPDVLFLTPLRVDWILQPQTNSILIPDFQHMAGCNDRFAIGCPSAMKIYGERYKKAYEYSKVHALHSEQFLADHMRSNGLYFIPIPFYFRRIRATGVVHEGDKDL